MSTEQLSGEVKHITYHDEASGFTVVQVNTAAGQKKVVATTRLPIKGETIQCSGRWETAKHGAQFKASEVSFTPPVDTDGMLKFLSSGLIKGVGKVYAKKLVDTHGENLPDIIENNPMSLYLGVGQKKVEALRKGWKEYQSQQEIMAYLMGLGFGPKRAINLLDELGEGAPDKIKSNPYLLTSIGGFGFGLADQAAQKSGISPTAPSRVQAGIRYALEDLSKKGHVSCTKEMVFRASEKLLNHHGKSVDRPLLGEQLGLLCGQKQLIHESWDDKSYYFLPGLHYAEKRLSAQLGRLSQGVTPWQIDDLDLAIDRAEAEAKIGLSPSQRFALKVMLRSKVSVLTGGPGTGKTLLTNILMSILEREGIEMAIAAPSGKAAKRIEEVTKRPAKTIHRLLEYSPRGGWTKGAKDPLEADLVLADEMSLADTNLADRLTQAVKENAAMIWVGDRHQLPSVGPGNVFADVIDSGEITCVELTEIFRQAQESSIILHAHTINDGMMINTDAKAEDFDYIEVDNDEQAADAIEQVITQDLAKKGYQKHDIQVLTPMRRGAAGMDALNDRLKQVLNKGSGKSISIGDRIIMTKNDYDNDVFNGDSGTVLALRPKDNAYEIEFDDGRCMWLKGKAANGIMLAYALTIHRSQGSQFKAVVIPVLNSHYIMAERNLIYTALTRAQEHVVLVGQRRALEQAIKTVKAGQRRTLLADRIRLNMAE